MKTIEYIETHFKKSLQKEIINEIKASCERHGANFNDKLKYLEDDQKNPGHFLSCCFIFENSKKGHKYWIDIAIKRCFII